MFAQSDRMRIISALFFSGKVRRKFYLKLAAMTENGLGLNDALETMHERLARKSNPQRVIFSEALLRMQGGASLADAFYGFIPDAEYMLIKSGVDGGDLPNALELTCGLIEAKQKIVKAIVEALSYPILLCSLLLIFMLVLAHYVVPQLSLIVDPAGWRGAAATLYSAALFIASPSGGLLLCGVAGSLASILSTFPYFTGKLRVKCDKLPPWSLYRLIQGSIWLFTLATMLKANVQLSVVLDDMLESSKRNRWLTERIYAFRAQLNLGKSLGEALDDSGFEFPDKEIVEDLVIYSTLPGFDARLYSIAQQWLAEGIDHIKGQCKILNYALLFQILAVLCSIALAVSSLQQQLSPSVQY